MGMPIGCSTFIFIEREIATRFCFATTLLPILLTQRRMRSLRLASCHAIKMTGTATPPPSLILSKGLLTKPDMERSDMPTRVLLILFEFFSGFYSILLNIGYLCVREANDPTLFLYKSVNRKIYSLKCITNNFINEKAIY